MKHEKMAQLETQCREYFTEQDKKIVFGEGNTDAAIMLIGEAPGRQEIEQGRPFVGQAGKNLDEFIKILNIKREDMYITNVVKYRPTKINPKTSRLVNRPPTKTEIHDSRIFLIQQIEIVAPRVIVTLGNIPLRTVLHNEKLNIGELHGTVQQMNINQNIYSVFPLYHPASIIYKRDLKTVYKQDLLKLKELTTSLNI